MEPADIRIKAPVRNLHDDSVKREALWHGPGSDACVCVKRRRLLRGIRVSEDVVFFESSRVQDSCILRGSSDTSGVAW